MASKKQKIFWAWVAIEIAATAWLGVQVAIATETPWARQPKPPKTKLPGAR